MGYIAHDTITVATWRTEQDDQLAAFRASLPEDWRRLLIGPIPAAANSESFWTFLPDGSKEGWGTSNVGDEHREAFLNLLREMGADHVHVRWGGDHGREVGATIEAQTGD